MRQGSISLTGSETSLGMLSDSCIEITSSPSSREASVIRLRFGLEDDTPRTLTEIGEQMGISRERVRQIEASALLKLRQPQRRKRMRDYLGSFEG